MSKTTAMENMNTFLDLVSSTNGRDKVLRLIQYLTLHSIEFKQCQKTQNVYQQIRKTRKVLRFLRSLQCSTKIRLEITNIKQTKDDKVWMISKIATIFENLFRLLFYLSDHRVLLSEIGVIDKSHHITHYPRSYKSYFLENLFGLIKNICDTYLVFTDGKVNGQRISYDQQHEVFFDKISDIIRCILDMLIALFYWKNIMSANKAGVIGVISSIIAIKQCLKRK